MFRRIAAVVVLLVLAGIAVFFYGRTAVAPGHRTPVAPPGAKAGGTLTATLRAEPATFNRFVSNGFPTHLVSLLTDGRLVRVNPETDRPEPWLAETVTRTDTAIDITLRPGLRFSDGTPATADDVVWSLKAAYATAQGGVGDGLRLDGAEIQARAESPTRVVLTLPGPWATAERLLEALPIYPRAVVEPALASDTFAAACSTTAPCPGLGPFAVARYEAGQRVVLERNPHYWRTDAAGAKLPYLDSLVLEIVPDQNAELLRLTGGQADVLQSELRSEDIRTLRPDADAGRVVLTDVGPGLDRHMLWFNLGPAPIDPAKAFLRQDAFRQAVSLAVDRTGFANTVFLGAATAVLRARVGGQQGVDRRRSAAARVQPRAGGDAARRHRAARSQQRRHPRGRLGPSRALRGAGAVGHHRGADGDGLRARRAGQRRRRHGHRRAGHGHGDGPVEAGAVRRGVPVHPGERHRSGQQPGLLAVARQLPPVASRAGHAGDAVGGGDRSAHAAGGLHDGPGRARRESSRRCSG